jgi:hypothetical protein
MKNNILDETLRQRFLEEDLNKEKSDMEYNNNLIRRLEKKLDKKELRERINKIKKYFSEEFSLENRAELNNFIEAFEDLMKFYREQLMIIKERYGNEAKIPMEDLDEESNQKENKYIKFFDKNRIKIKLDITTEETKIMNHDTITDQTEEIIKKLNFLKKKIANNINYLNIDKILNERVDYLLEKVNNFSNKIQSDILLLKEVIGKFDVHLRSYSEDNINDYENGNINDIRHMDKKINSIIDILKVKIYFS